MRTASVVLGLMLLCTSCKEGYDHQGRTPLVEVDGNFFYREDLQKAMPANLSGEDSASFAERYVREWIEDVLLYEKAQSNIPDNDALEE